MNKLTPEKRAQTLQMMAEGVSLRAITRLTGISRTTLIFNRFREYDGWVYVWGEVKYDDGFVKDRFTKFCHRYERRGFHDYEFSGDRLIRPAWIGHSDGGAIYHEHGNDAD